MNCIICDSPNLTWLGNLGSFDWYRCRNCTMDNNEPAAVISGNEFANETRVLEELAEVGCEPDYDEHSYCRAHKQEFPCDRQKKMID